MSWPRWEGCAVLAFAQPLAVCLIVPCWLCPGLGLVFLTDVLVEDYLLSSEASAWNLWGFNTRQMAFNSSEKIFVESAYLWEKKHWFGFLKKCSCDCQKLAWFLILVLWGQLEDWVTTQRSSPFCKDPSPLLFQEYPTVTMLGAVPLLSPDSHMAHLRSSQALHSNQFPHCQHSAFPITVCMGATKASWWHIVWIIPHKLWDPSQKSSASSQRTLPPP